MLQTTLFAEAARAIREGADVVLVTGGEARHRAQRARAAGQPEALSEQPAGTAPDRVLRPAAEIVHPVEIARRFVVPVAQYALIENALRREAGLSPEAQRRELADFWAGFARVASANPHAWSRKPPDASALLDDAGRNPMLAFPYGRLHCSQWNVDQAAGLVFCSAERARRARIPESRWIHLARGGGVESHEAAGGARLARALAGLLARVAARARAGGPRARIARRARALQLLSVGGPHPAARVRTSGRADTLRHRRHGLRGRSAQQLRAAGARANRASCCASGAGAALLTAVSGMLTKQGVSLWSCEPGPAGFGYADVSEEAARAEAPRSVVDGAGAGEVVGYTALYEAGAPARIVAIVDHDDGLRGLAASDDPELARRAVESELAGTRVRVAADGALAV